MNPTTFGDGLRRRNGSVPWYMHKVSKLQLLRSAVFILKQAQLITSFSFLNIRDIETFQISKEEVLTSVSQMFVFSFLTTK